MVDDELAVGWPKGVGPTFRRSVHTFGNAFNVLQRNPAQGEVEKHDPQRFTPHAVGDLAAQPNEQAQPEEDSANCNEEGAHEDAVSITLG